LKGVNVVSLYNEWKLDPSCKFVGKLLSSRDPCENLQEAIEALRHKRNIDNSFGQIEEKDSLENTARGARDTLMQAILLYAKNQKSKNAEAKGCYFLTLRETINQIRKELDNVINGLSAFEFRLTKRNGESLEHYLMRGVILQYLNDDFGVKEFYEEYSKLSEVLRKFSRGERDSKIWEKAAKRADLYVILNNGVKLWIEVERTTNSKELSKKLKKVKTVSLSSPELIDKVVFVFPSMPPRIFLHMTEAILIEGRKIGFPLRKLEVYEVDLIENQVVYVENPSLVEVEFNDRLLEMIGNGTENPKGKVGMTARKSIHERIIVPLVNNELPQLWINEKQDKMKKLIHFWRTRTMEFTVPASEIEFKENAIRKIKKDYPFLIA
jgi:hypothetical protein